MMGRQYSHIWVKERVAQGSSMGSQCPNNGYKTMNSDKSDQLTNNTGTSMQDMLLLPEQLHMPHGQWRQAETKSIKSRERKGVLKGKSTMGFSKKWAALFTKYVKTQNNSREGH
ncbi:hypothetical protein ACSQ67_006149 [Phaseolus vulgaris]